MHPTNKRQWSNKQLSQKTSLLDVVYAGLKTSDEDIISDLSIEQHEELVTLIKDVIVAKSNEYDREVKENKT